MENAMSHMNQNLASDSSSTIQTDKKNTSGIRTGKARRKRTVYSREQLDVLNRAFCNNKYPGIKERESLSQVLGVMESRIHVWFQNARARNSQQRRKGDAKKNKTKNIKRNVANHYQLSQPIHEAQEGSPPRPKKDFNHMVLPGRYPVHCMGHPGPSHASDICTYNATSSQALLSSRGIAYQDIHAPPNNQAQFSVPHQPCSNVPINMNTQGTSGSATASFYANPRESTREMNEDHSLQMLLDYAQSILSDFPDNSSGALEELIEL